MKNSQARQAVGRVRSERTFEAPSASGGKFWAVSRVENEVHFRFGKVQTKGSNRKSTFADWHAAEVEMQAVIEAKLRKGYVETTGRIDAETRAAVNRSFSTQSSFAEAPRAMVTSLVPDSPAQAGPRFIGFQLADDDPEPVKLAKPDEDHQLFRANDCYEHDSSGSTLYREFHCKFPIANSEVLKTVVTVRTPFLFTMQNESAAWELAKLVNNLYGGERQITIHRILDSTEVRVVVKSKASGVEDLGFISKFKRGDRIVDWYRRIGQQLMQETGSPSEDFTINVF